jgi:hypothetical protein
VSRKCIYIAGPLNAPAVGYLQNVHRFQAAQIALIRHGFAPFNPAVDLLAGIMAGDMEYEDYFEPNFAWLEKADAVLMLGSSPGADRECERARELGVPVLDSVAALVEYFASEWVDALPCGPDN